MIFEGGNNKAVLTAHSSCEQHTINVREQSEKFCKMKAKCQLETHNIAEENVDILYLIVYLYSWIDKGSLKFSTFLETKFQAKLIGVNLNGNNSVFDDENRRKSCVGF